MTSTILFRSFHVTLKKLYEKFMEPIPIDNALKAFKEHLEVNERTVFSAKFGDGKTYFLNEFKKLHKKDYYFITLYPVNYSVAENQDIFEYIKRDILFQLAIDDKLNPIDFESIANSIFTWENLKEVLCFLISCMPKGEILTKIIEKGGKIAQKYKEEQTTFQKYNSWFTSQKGGLYEHDGYTKLIIETLKYIKGSGYKTALIIEDLDRIDPAHLFRILNVLGAHIDGHLYREYKDTNKFGFDNIIIVFDYDTTKNIFHHFYGQNANYDGYINKFINQIPFSYSITQTAQTYLIDFITKECNVSDTLSDIHNIYSKIKKLSVRDIQQIIHNSRKYIINKEISLNNESIITDSTLTRFISILILLGFNKNDITHIINHNLSDLGRVRVIGTFLLFVISNDNYTIRYNEKFYSLSRNKDSNGIITSLNINQIRGFSIIELNNEMIDRCLNKGFEYIKGIY